MGHPLSQTIFTSLYIDKLLSDDPRTSNDLTFGPKNAKLEDSSLVHRALLAYCLATIKTCFHVIERVKSEHFYEVGSTDMRYVW